VIIATVTTCPQRWVHYRRLRREFAALDLPFPLRTFQTSECLEEPRVNENLNGRAALRYCQARFKSRMEPNWVMYLEDDTQLHAPLCGALDDLLGLPVSSSPVCWYLCNRKNPVRRRFKLGSLVVNELGHPIEGSHALMLPDSVLPALLEKPWRKTVDIEIFAVLRQRKVPVVQVVDPLLAEHIGVCSTYNPEQRQVLEVNHAN